MIRHAWRGCALGPALFLMPGCLYVVRGGPTVWTHPDQATVVGGRATLGAGMGDNGAGFDVHMGIAAGADVESGTMSLAGTPGVEWIRAPAPVGFHLGAEADIRALFV